MFSKSKVKRFKDEASCGPPVGTYNLPDHKSKTTSFHKSERFKDPKVLPVKDISRNKSDSSLHSFSKGAMLLQYQSTCKKKEPQPKRYLKENSDIGFDFCRKSLEADVEFQESKVNSLLEKVRSLEVQMKETKLHSDDIEQSNQKLLDLLESIRKENFTLQQKNEELTVALNKIVEEKGEIEKLLKEKLQYVDELKREIDNLRSQHEKEKEHLNEKLSTAQDLNCDFREQLESVELAMTENLRGLSDKYETLENTLEQVQKDYRNRLERSNSLLKKTKEAHEKSKEELTTMQNINETLKGNIETISKEVNTSKEELNNKEILIQKYKEKELEFMEEISCIENTIGQERKVMKEKIAAHEKQVELSMENEIELKRKYDMLQAEHSKTIAAMQSEIDEGKNKEKSLEADIVMLEEKLMTAQEEMNIQKVHFKEKEEQVSRLETNLMTAREEINIQKVHFKEKEEQVSRERKQMQEEFMKIQNEVAKQLMETQIKLSNAEAKIANTIDEKQYESVVTEMEMWRKKYNELEKKVAPFMSELDRFEMEKESLLNENKYTQQEMNKLSEKYAQILGHQNNKQKIHHIRKLKEENLSLKTEVMRLRSLQHKAGKTKLSDNGSSIRDKKSAKLFSHPNKENDQSYRQPLKTSNT